jgi:hypothetical protein
MSKTTLDILNHFLNEGGNREHILEESRDWWDNDWEAEEFDAVYEEMVEKMVQLAVEISDFWGPPTYETGDEPLEVPLESFGDEVAVWARGERYAYVAVRHEDKELPILLLVGVSDGGFPGQ